MLLCTTHAPLLLCHVAGYDTPLNIFIMCLGLGNKFSNQGHHNIVAAHVLLDHVL